MHYSCFGYERVWTAWCLADAIGAGLSTAPGAAPSGVGAALKGALRMW